MDPVTTVAVIAISILAGIGATTLYFAVVLIAQQIRENRQSRAEAQRLTSGGSITI